MPGFALRAAAGDAAARRGLMYHAAPRLHALRLALARPWRAAGVNRFLDVGANVGGGLAAFARLFPPERFAWTLLEPNPACLPALRAAVAARAFPRGVRILPAAAWTAAGTMALHGLAETGDPIAQGASLIAGHNAAAYQSDPAQALVVPTVDCAELMAEAQAGADFVAAKLDVEGAELDILERLWAEPGLFRAPTWLFVEFHALWAADPAAARARERALRRASPPGVRLLDWY